MRDHHGPFDEEERRASTAKQAEANYGLGANQAGIGSVGCGGAPAVAMHAMNAVDMHHAEKLSVERLYGHVGAFVKFPSAHNYDNLSLALREMQTAWMNGRKRVME